VSIDMRITTPIVLTVLIACGSRAPAPTPQARPAPSGDRAGDDAAPVAPPAAPATTAAPAPAPKVDVGAECKLLAGADWAAHDPAVALGRATDNILTAVTCLADRLDRAAGLWVGGSEQEYERKRLREALAGSIAALTGVDLGPFDLDDYNDLTQLAHQARTWVTLH
jgi:hypothetical protein